MLDKVFYKTLLTRAFTFPVRVNFWDGKSVVVGGEGEPEATITFREKIPVSDMTHNSSLALGEAIMDGKLVIDGSLQKIITSVYNAQDSFIHDSSLNRFIPRRSHSEKASLEDVGSHYNISNDFYRMWLDPTMTYSCAYFTSDSDTLEEAQMNKVHHILRKLHLHEEMRLLDIGCGWGTLVITAAQEYGAHATGITLSTEQKKFAEARIEELGLQDRIDIRLEDYRALGSEQWDAIVSVGMFEHVGKENLGEYFRVVERHLAENGVALIHGITEQENRPGHGTNAWIDKYIFPGGYLPALSEIIDHITQSRLQISDLEPLRRHYQRTLEMWHANFTAVRDQVADMFDERFCRMWDLYLQSCAASFESGNIDVIQYLLSKRVSGAGLPMTRAYMYE